MEKETTDAKLVNVWLEYAEGNIVKGVLPANVIRGAHAISRKGVIFHFVDLGYNSDCGHYLYFSQINPVYEITEF